jgi:heme A synthase
MFEKRIKIPADARVESPPPNSGRWLVAFGWATLAFNIAVILWGAYVRATGSGAGCGNHWPLCNGALTPNASIQTAIELTHRVTSGVLLLSVLCLWGWTRLRMPGKHPSRYTAAIAAFLVVNEALLGALLVVFEHVAQDKSIARSVWLSLHSVNTMLLLAAIALTAFWAGRPSSSVLHWPATSRVLLPALLVTMLFVGATGTVAALGDTLFPAASLSSSFAQDFSSKSHYLLRLRILHPATAVIATVLIPWFLASTWRSANKSLQRLAIVVSLIFLLQLTLGVLNIVLLAPIWLQMLHLLTADVLWTTLVLLAAKSLSSQGAPLTRIGHKRRLEYPFRRRLLANKPIVSVTASSVDSHSGCEPGHEIVSSDNNRSRYPA